MIPSASTLTDFRVVLLIIIAGSAAAGGDTPANPAGHWAFEPPRPHAPPPVQRTDWPVNDIDRFILAKLESVKLSPSPPADRRTLIRRAHFDLLGLPPTFEQVQVFLDDSSADSYERLIDELLASPRYGERWGRYWLDLARYADTKGYVYGNREERFFVHAHAYRDWVIAALNADMPYDEFLTLQIAADHIPQGQPKSRWDSSLWAGDSWESSPTSWMTGSMC
jgi:hypothetical protein